MLDVSLLSVVGFIKLVIFVDLLEGVETTCIELVDKKLDNQLASSLLTTCSRSQASDANTS